MLEPSAPRPPQAPAVLVLQHYPQVTKISFARRSTCLKKFLCIASFAPRMAPKDGATSRGDMSASLLEPFRFCKGQDSAFVACLLVIFCCCLRNRKGPTTVAFRDVLDMTATSATVGKTIVLRLDAKQTWSIYVPFGGSALLDVLMRCWKSEIGRVGGENKKIDKIWQKVLVNRTCCSRKGTSEAMWST